MLLHHQSKTPTQDGAHRIFYSLFSNYFLSFFFLNQSAFLPHVSQINFLFCYSFPSHYCPIQRANGIYVLCLNKTTKISPNSFFSLIISTVCLITSTCCTVDVPILCSWWQPLTCCPQTGTIRNPDNKYNYKIDLSSTIKTAKKFFIRGDYHKPMDIIKLIMKHVHTVKTEFRQFARSLRGIDTIHFIYR